MNSHRTKYDTFYEEALAELTKSGSVEGVYRFIDSLQGEDYRDHTLMRVAQFFAARGELATALQFCMKIKDSVERAQALLEVGAMLKGSLDMEAAKNVFDVALEAVEAIERDYDKASALLLVATQLQGLNCKDEALKILRSAIKLSSTLPQEFEAAKTVRGCARLLASWNLQSEAIAVAKSIDSRWSELRDTAMEEVRGGGRWPVRPLIDTEGGH